MVLAAGDDGWWQLWDLDRAAVLREWQVPAEFNRVRAVAVTAGSRTLSAGSDSNRLLLWDLVTGQLLRTFTCCQAAEPEPAPPPPDASVPPWGASDYIMSLAITPDGSRALTGSEEGTVLLWDLTGD